jgi:hypothetical protein
MLLVIKRTVTLKNTGKEVYMKIQFNKEFGSVWNAVEELCKISFSFRESVGWRSKEMVLPTNIEQLQTSLKDNI